MGQFERGNLNEDIKEQINNLKVPLFEQSLNSFASSRNQFSKINHRLHEDSPQPNELSIFPINNDQSIQFIEGQSFVDMHKKPRTNRAQAFQELAYENNILAERVKYLEHKLSQNQSGSLLSEQGTQNQTKRGSVPELKRLESALAEKDRKNIQLFNINKGLVEELRMLKEETESKSKQLMSKTLELKREKEKLQSLSKQNDQEKVGKTSNLVQNLERELERRNTEISQLKIDNKALSNTVLETNDQLQCAKEQFIKQMEEQTHRYKSTTRELLDRLKTQQSLKSTSIRSSTVSNSSLSQSFSPQMLSPEETVQLIFHVLRKISKSQMMLKILFSSSDFTKLIGWFGARLSKGSPSESI